ncbi:MAG: hypothetical protein ACYTG5_17900 [Planctomycetota bacterium]|jgi:hypothetical protein
MTAKIDRPNLGLGHALLALLLLAWFSPALAAQQPATFFNRNVPQELHDSMVTLRNAGHTILSVAFPPAGGNSWSLVTDQAFLNRNVPQDCHNKMIEFANAGHQILGVAFPPAGGNSWSVITDQSFFNQGVPQACHDKMVERAGAGESILSVAFPPVGGDSWSIITDGGFYNRNVPQACHDKMFELYSLRHLNRWVAFPPAGGNTWSVITDRSFYNWGVPTEVGTEMLAMMSEPGALRLIAYTPDGKGYSIVSHVPEVSLTIAPSQIENVTADTLVVKGRNLHRVTKVNFGGVDITSTDSSDPTKPYFTIVSAGEIHVHTPQGMATGSYAMTAASDWSVSNAETVDLVPSASSLLLVAPNVTAGDLFSVYIAAGAVNASQAFLAYSIHNTPSVFPGIISMGIGANFSHIRVLPGPIDLLPGSSAGHKALQSVPNLMGSTLHFQAIYVVAPLPLPVSTVGTTTFQ